MPAAGRRGALNFVVRLFWAAVASLGWHPVCASLSAGSSLSSITQLVRQSDGVNPIGDLAADTRGVLEAFGSDPSFAEGFGLVDSGPSGVVNYFGQRSSDTVLLKDTLQVVYTSPEGRFVPSAICGGFVAVADRNLKFFEKQAGTWTQVHSIGDESGPGQLFLTERVARQVRWNCNEGGYVIVANSGGPMRSGASPSGYSPRIHVFSSSQGNEPANYTLTHSLSIDTWELPHEDGGGSGNTLFDDPAYLYNDAESRFTNSSLERVAVSQHTVVSLAAYYPGTLFEKRGFPLFVWEFGDFPSSPQLFTTRGDRACEGTPAMRTARISLDVVEVGQSMMAPSPVVIVGCPAPQGDVPPVIEAFRRVSKAVCNSDVLVLQKVSNLFAAGGSGDFPGLSPIDLLPDGGLSTVAFGPFDDPNSMLPGVRVVQGSTVDDFSTSSAHLLIGDPGYDHKGVVDAGRVLLVELALDATRLQEESSFRVTVEKIITPPSPQQSENFGGWGLFGKQRATNDAVAIASPRRSPRVTIAAGVSPRADQQIIASPDNPGSTFGAGVGGAVPFFSGHSIDATDRWLAVAEPTTVRLYSNADGVPGFGPTLQVASHETPVEHSTLLSLPIPWSSGAPPSSSMPESFRGVPMVKFVPGTSTHDGRPRLLVVHPSATASDQQWVAALYWPTTTSSAAYDEVVASDFAWQKEASVSLPAGYNPCSTVYNPCEASGDPLCLPYANYTCANRILALDLPRGHSSKPLDEGLINLQSSKATPLDAETAAGASGPGLGRGLPGCETGMSFGLPDAGDTPSVVLLCASDLRKASTNGPRVRLLNHLLPDSRSDGRLVIGQTCTHRGLATCVNSTARAAGGAAASQAGTRVVSGVLSGVLVIGAADDAERLEMWRWNTESRAFVPLLSSAAEAADPSIPAPSAEWLHPVAAAHGKDVAALEGAGMLVTGGPQNSLQVSCVVARPPTVELRSCGTLPPPAAITSTNDKCKRAEFGTSIIVDKAMLVNEGFFLVASTNLRTSASCTAEVLASGQSEILTAYTIDMHPLQRLAMLDTGYDRLSEYATGQVQRELSSLASGTGGINSNHTRLLDLTIQHRMEDGEIPLPAARFLASFELRSVGVSFPATGELAWPMAEPAIYGAQASGLRTGAWALARTGQSPELWHRAGKIGGGVDIVRQQAVSLGGAVDPLDMLSAGAGHLRLWKQVAGGVVQVDRKLVAVSTAVAASSENGASLFSPLDTVTQAVVTACEDSPSLCDPVVVIGNKATDDAVYIPQSLEASNLPLADADSSSLGLVSVVGTAAFALDTGTAWRGWNVTIRGAGMDRTRLVLSLPDRSSALPAAVEPLAAGGLRLVDLTLQGGAAAKEMGDPGFAGIAGGGGILTVAGGTTKPWVRMQRVRAIDGRSRASGGVLSATLADVELVDSIVGSSSAELRGGAVFVSGGRLVSFRSLIGQSYSLSQSGGCVSLQASSVAAIDQSTLFECSSGASGGAIATSESDAFLTRSHFYLSQAFTNGGALESSFGRVRAWGCDFSRNSAEGDGGAVHVTQSSGSNGGSTDAASGFNDCSFVANQAETGGAVRVSAGGQLRTTRCGFAFNRALASGGAGAVTSKTAIWSDGGSVMRANIADAQGGSVLVGSSGTFRASGTIAVGNYAPSGGGIACVGGSSFLADIDRAKEWSGLQLSPREIQRLRVNSSSELPGVLIQSNLALNQGGGILSTACNGTLSNPQLIGNHIGTAVFTIPAVLLVLEEKPSNEHVRRPLRSRVREPFLRVAQQQDPFDTTVTTGTTAADGLSLGVPTQWDSSYKAGAGTFVSAKPLGTTTAIVPTDRDASGLPNLDAKPVQASAESEDSVGAASLSDGGGALYASTLKQSGATHSLVIDSGRFVDNTAPGGSGGCVFAAGVSDDADCGLNPGKCYRDEKYSSFANFLRLSSSVLLRQCVATRGPGIFWSMVPFAGTTDVANSSGLVALNTTAHPPPVGVRVQLAGNKLSKAVTAQDTQDSQTDDAFYAGDYSAGLYDDYTFDFGYGSGDTYNDPTGTAGGDPSTYYSTHDDFINFGGYEYGYDDNLVTSNDTSPPTNDDNFVATNDNFVATNDNVVATNDNFVATNDNFVATNDIIGVPGDSSSSPEMQVPARRRQLMTRRRRRLQVAKLPVIESMPASLRLMPGFALRTRIEPGGEVSVTQGSLKLELVDAFGSPALHSQLSVVASSSLANGSASIIGSSVSTASAGSNAITYGSLKVRAAANSTRVLLSFTAQSMGGVPPIEHNLTIEGDCPGRQELRADAYDTCFDCGVGQVSDGLTCSSCSSGRVVGPVDPLQPRGVCVDCPAGKAENQGVCQPCTAGRFTDAPGRSSCAACDSGRFSRAGSSNCTQCAPGFFSFGAAAETCQPCSTGTYASGPGTAVCTECPAGRFADQTGSTLCQACRGNTIAALNRTTRCTECGSGSVAINDKTVCGACPAGTQASANDAGVLSCRVCPTGMVTTAEGQLCSSCESNSLPNQHRTGCLTCHEFATCLGGTFSLRESVWWPDNAVMVDVDVAGEAWVYIPPTAELHECANAGACNVSINALLRDAQLFAASLATNQNLSTTDRATVLRQRLQSSLATSQSGVSCAQGHTGPRCALCEPGYSRVSGDGACVECFETELNFLVVAAGVIVVLLAASFLVNNTYKTNTKNKAGSNVTSGLVRTIMNYLKVIATLGDFKTRAPAVIQALRSGASTVSSGVPVDVGPVACAFSLNFERQLTAVITMPVVIIIGTAVVCFLLYVRAAYCPHRCGWLFCSCICGSGRGQIKPDGKDAPREGGRFMSAAAKADAAINRAAAARTSVPAGDRRLVAHKYCQFCTASMVILLFLVYSMLVKQVFTAWNLYPRPISGRWFLEKDFSVATDSPEYSRISALAIIGVSVWVIGIPGAALFLLYRRRHNLLEDDTQTSLGFLYAGYNVGTASLVNGETAVQARKVLTELQHLADKDQLALGQSARSMPTQAFVVGGSSHSDEDITAEVDEIAAERSASSPRFHGGKAGGTSKEAAAVGQESEHGQQAHGVAGITLATAVPKTEQDRSPNGTTDDMQMEDMDSISDVEGGDDHHELDPAPGSKPKAGAERETTSSVAPQRNERAVSFKPNEDASAPTRGRTLPPTASFKRRQHHKHALEARKENTQFLASIVKELEANAAQSATNFWYWEVVVLARLVLVTVVAVFVSDPFMQSYAALMIIIAALVAHLAAHPYADAALNFAESLGLITVLATQLGSLLWFLEGTDVTTIDDTVTTILLIILNVAVLVVFAVMLVLSLIGDRRLRAIPWCGQALATAFYKERDLRRRYNAAQFRRMALHEAHTSKGKKDEAEQRAKRKRAMEAVAIGGVAAGAAGAASAGWMSTFA